MRIVLFHNWYQHAGGEDTVVRTEMSLLTARGHHVSLLDADNRTIEGLMAKVRTASGVAHSESTRRRVTQALIALRPDIVHVHNFFPLLTPSVLDACRSAGVPVVHTLHNFRLLCPGAMLLRAGEPCELCVTGSSLNAVRYRCYRGSYVGSLAAGWMVAAHRRLDTFSRKVDTFIALTEFAKSVFVRAGFPAERILVKPDATPDPEDLPALETAVADRPATEPHAIFLGRLSSEKGITTLLRAWPKVPIPLHIAGTGPYITLVSASAQREADVFRYLGFLPPESVNAELRKAEFLVMPSRCYEGFGVVLIEAFAHGIPVIASNLGSMAEIVDDGVTGLLFDPHDPVDLAAKATWLVEHPKERRRMGEAARRTYVDKYGLDTNYRKLMDVYDRAKEHAAQRLG